MQRLDNSVAAMNGADGISSVIGCKRKGAESSMTTWRESDSDNHKSTKKISMYQKQLVNMVRKWPLLQK